MKKILLYPFYGRGYWAIEKYYYLTQNHSASMIIPKPGRTRVQGQVTCSPELVFITANDSIFYIMLFFIYTIISIWKVFPYPVQPLSLFALQNLASKSLSIHITTPFLSFLHSISLCSLAQCWGLVLYPGQCSSITEPWIFICKCLSFHLYCALAYFYTHKLLSLMCVQYLSEKWLIFVVYSWDWYFLLDIHSGRDWGKQNLSVNIHISNYINFIYINLHRMGWLPKCDAHIFWGSQDYIRGEICGVKTIFTITLDVICLFLPLWHLN